MLLENKLNLSWDQPYPETISEKDLVIWKIPTETFSNLFASYGWVMNDDEYKKANRFHKLKDFQNYVIGKIATRLLLSLYLKCNPSDLRFEKNVFQKPYLVHHSNLHFNISKSEGLVIVALSKSEVGVDIEKAISLKDLSIIESIFSESEQKYISEDSFLFTKRFYELWTRKESYLKKRGTGINVPLNSLSVSLPSITNRYKNLLFQSIVLDDNYYISICYQRNVENITFHDFNLCFLKSNAQVLR